MQRLNRTVRLSDTEWIALSLAAERDGAANVSEYARSILVRHIAGDFVERSSARQAFPDGREIILFRAVLMTWEAVKTMLEASNSGPKSVDDIRAKIENMLREAGLLPAPKTPDQ